jgi:hypothetical protein
MDVVIHPKKVAATIAFEPLLNEVRQAFVVIEKKLVKGKEGSSGSRKPEAGSPR